LKEFDTVIIGGGFYGLRIAQFLNEELGQKRVLVIEKEADVMQRASYNNQARVHNGYHYPRSVLTALRSRVNLPVFYKEYEHAVVKDFVKYYGVATQFSKVSARQFLRFCQRIGAKINPAPEALKWFSPKLIEAVFEVEEYAFNSAILKKMLLKRLGTLKIVLHMSERVISVTKENNLIVVKTNKGEYLARYVLNTTYSSINDVNKNSHLPIIPLKHELTEMCLVELPDNMKNKAFTIMCGPFFSIMPFPDKKAFTLSHVRYTPHSEWHDSESSLRDSHKYLDDIKKVSHYPQMLADLKRYMPELAAQITYTGESIWEIKTVLPQSEGDDSRPILYKENFGGLKNYICIMGGKLDNVYDVLKELRITYEKNT
jgi:glycine/D-amino acid oxidase-like deaminating enzyme